MLPTVYNVHLPPEYYEWTAFLDIFKLDWSAVTIPGACLPGGYYNRLLLRGIGPLVLLAGVFVLQIIYSLGSSCFRQCLAKRDEYQKLSRDPKFVLQSVLDAVPLVLFICFCLCASTSSSIFATWSCAEYAYDSTADPPTYMSFLRADLSLKCADIDGDETLYTAEYTQVKSAAWAFIVVWPVLMPVLFLVVLLPSRAALLSRRSTRLVRATAFLHSEYEPMYFW